MPRGRVALLLDSPAKGNRRHHLQLQALKEAGFEPRVIFLSGDPSGCYLELKGHANFFRSLKFSRDRVFRSFSTKAFYRLMRMIQEEDIRVILTQRIRLLRYLIPLKIYRPRLRIIFYLVIGNVFRSPGRRLFFRLAQPFVDLILVNSRHLKEEVLSLGFVSPEKVDILYSGLEVSEFDLSVSKKEARRRFGFPEREFLFGMVARFRKEKDHAGLLRAFRLFLDQGGKASLILAGDGPLEAEIRELAHNLHLVERVRFLGRVPMKEVPYLLRTLDVFVYPTFREGMPMAVMEAMAAGLPIIATEAEGLPDLFDTPLEFGRLLPPGDPERLAQAMFEVFSLTEEDKAKLGAAARQRLEEAFSAEVLKQRTVEIVRNLLSA
ncbi:glycosyltransferase family 4 protein [Thermosulfurimonas sp. F29]|uniref:glycosyltransferase family 4 protein n=1 Tax=Thermosulfurimonas sp. F29 TaxID=2867247 RepID=UPI001C82988D|nr:glycosyltransferase family 4 protein [Thermosulfurimonas sp. F29]MBX6422824.1 glycosyltransferase family 4 protein [Thermosulfurimonas sp. F29]